MIAVFGANGQIGSWLVQWSRSRELDVVAVHRGSLSPRNARYPINHRVADLQDIDSIRDAVEGCDVVVNLAVDKAERTGRSDLVRSNIAATQNLVRACEETGTRRLIHVSSVAVLPTRITDEVLSRPFGYSKENDSYTRSKVATEQAVRKAGARLEVCILRPGVVYGPYLTWSSLVLSRCAAGVLHFASDGPSICPAVHVLDVVRIIAHLAKAEGRLPPLLYAVNPETVSWADFYQTHARCAGLPFRKESHPYEELRRRAAPRRTAIKTTVLESPPFVRGMEQILSHDSLRRPLRAIKSAATRKRPSEDEGEREESTALAHWWPGYPELELYASSATFSAEATGERMGFEYAVSLEEGCRGVGTWWNFSFQGMSRTEADMLGRLLWVPPAP